MIISSKIDCATNTPLAFVSYYTMEIRQTDRHQQYKSEYLRFSLSFWSMETIQIVFFTTVSLGHKSRSHQLLGTRTR